MILLVSLIYCNHLVHNMLSTIYLKCMNNIVLVILYTSGLSIIHTNKLGHTISEAYMHQIFILKKGLQYQKSIHVFVLTNSASLFQGGVCQKFCLFS